MHAFRALPVAVVLALIRLVKALPSPVLQDLPNLNFHDHTHVKVLVTNDDGWAEQNIRIFNDALQNSGYDTVLVAPTRDFSGAGSEDSKPKSLTQNDCQYDSCDPDDLGAVSGQDMDNVNVNWVNGAPASVVEYAINKYAKAFWKQKPNLVVAGVDRGYNSGNWSANGNYSGNVGAAVKAVNMGIPAVAFGSDNTDKAPYTATPDAASIVYAELATKLVDQLVDTTPEGEPYMPEGIWLNVVFPDYKRCPLVSDYSFTLTRIGGPADGNLNLCESHGHLLEDQSMIKDTTDCMVGISVARADNTTITAGTEDDQFEMNRRLLNILGCPPLL